RLHSDPEREDSGRHQCGGPKPVRRVCRAAGEGPAGRSEAVLMPALTVLGLVRLQKVGTDPVEEVTLTNDPDTYDPLDWPIRQSVHQVIADGPGTGTVRQSRGKWLTDIRVHIASGEQWWNKDLVQTLFTWQQDAAGSYRMLDSEGNIFTVAIDEFHPVPKKGLEGLYTASLELGVLGIEQLLGQPYTGNYTTR